MQHKRSLTRRNFLKAMLAVPALYALPLPRIMAESKHNGPVIEKITMLRIPGEFYRPVAMNAYDPGPKGKAGSIRLIRVFLSDGTMGLGVEGYVSIGSKTISFLKNMIGINPLNVYSWEKGQIREIHPSYRLSLQDPQYSWFEGPLLDLVGKLKGKPVYQLFGKSVRDGVDCYDGTLYFADVAANRDASIIGEIAKRIKEDGYQAIKLKVGRPYKWVKGEAGVKRDIEAFIAAREAVGSNFNLMADANNGYEGHFDWAVRFLKACAPYEMYWIEEIFPESIEEYRKLNQTLLENNAYIAIAEGEDIKWMEEFAPYLKSRIYRYIQPDMRTSGLTNILRAADMAADHGVSLVPHNWMSEMGKLMSIHASKIKKNIVFVEDDRYHNFAIDASSYAFRNGQWFVSERPGWGVDLSPHYVTFSRESGEMVID